MPPITAHRKTRWLFYFLVLVLTAPSSGCIAAAVTAGVVGAGAAGYAYWQGAVARDYPVSADQAWPVTQQALADLAMPVLSAQRDVDVATIESQTGDGTKVQITLESRTSKVPADGQWTHVSVRVGLVGDGQVSERVLNQIDTRLGPTVVPPGPLVPVAQTGAPPGAQTGPPPLARQ